MAFIATASARDIASLAAISNLSDVQHSDVIDIRDTQSCTIGSLPRARCLPVGHFVDRNGTVISFHALRWLLGTVGLTGGETVLVIGAAPEDTHRVGALLHQAGQRRVLMLDKPFHAPANAPSGTPRSLSRETVFTAPMRADLN